VTHDGMFNPQSAYGTTEEIWFNEWEFREPVETAATKGHPARQIPGAEPAQPWNYFDKPAAQDPFRKWSPMLAIKNAKTPTLVIHSQRDYRLDVSEGLQLFTALQRLNVPSKMLYFPDEGHWILKPQNSQLWYDTVGDWCDRWTKTNLYAEAGVAIAPAAVAKAKGLPDARVGVSRPAEMSETQALPERKTAAAESAAAESAPVVSPPIVSAAVPAAPAAVSGVAGVVAAPAASEQATPSGESEAGAASFSIVISAPVNEVQVGSDAQVVIALKNVSGRQILFAHRPGTNNPEFSYTIEVRSATGGVEETAYGREARERQQTENRTVEYVQPGRSVVQTAHIAKLVNLERPGAYTVVVSRKDAASGTVVRSNEITVNVVP
jgi:hypothetical protein